MTDHPLGNLSGEQPEAAKDLSIIDTILDLNEFLSAEVRLPEKTARICLRPDIEAEIDDLEAQLEQLVDPFGNPLEQTVEPSVADTASEHVTLAKQIAEKRREMAAATRSVRLRALDDVAWQAFRSEHRKAFEEAGDSPERQAMFAALVVASAVAPRITPEQWTEMRAKLSRPQADQFINTAWTVNNESGVSVPFSSTSSAVLKRKDRSSS